jgi:hypothetical protein
MTIRNKFNDSVKFAGNWVKEGLGDILTQELTIPCISKRLKCQ